MGLANYVENSKDENELANLIIAKIMNPDSKEKLEQICNTLRNDYSSENCAMKYWKIFKELEK